MKYILQKAVILEGLLHFAALKIHCSTACKELLDRLDGYILEKRGEIAIKGKGDMVTYWLVGEKENCRQSRVRVQKQQPKSSLRNATKCEHNFASSLDSPKKLRFAADDPAKEKENQGVKMLLESQILTSKGNSCPNLKVMHQSLEAHCVQKVESQSLSTTSLVEALDCIKMNHNRKKNNNKVLIDQDIQPLPKLPSANQAPTPKIELSPPE